MKKNNHVYDNYEVILLIYSLLTYISYMDASVKIRDSQFE